jgi:hypothetical protein
MDLDQGSKMIIFESILPLLKRAPVYKEAGGSGKKWLQLKIEPPRYK